MMPSKMFPPGLTHTHTHKFVIVMLLFLRCIGGQGQNSGYLSFGSMSSPGLTGYVMIPVNWNDNTIIGTPVTAVRIDLYLATLGSSICIDETATKNSVASPFTNTDVNISGSTILTRTFARIHNASKFVGSCCQTNQIGYDKRLEYYAPGVSSSLFWHIYHSNYRRAIPPIAQVS